MGRPKGSGKKSPKVAETPVHLTEKPETDVAPAIEQEKVEIALSAPVSSVAPFNTMRYHAQEQPRLFKAGEVIPSEWSDKNTWGWKYDDVKNRYFKR